LGTKVQSLEGKIEYQTVLKIWPNIIVFVEKRHIKIQ